jgi:hypothetical protein
MLSSIIHSDLEMRGRLEDSERLNCTGLVLSKDKNDKDIGRKGRDIRPDLTVCLGLELRGFCLFIRIPSN